VERRGLNFEAGSSPAEVSWAVEGCLASISLWMSTRNKVVVAGLASATKMLLWMSATVDHEDERPGGLSEISGMCSILISMLEVTA
jgi:hypothetical protein